MHINLIKYFQFFISFSIFNASYGFLIDDFSFHPSYTSTLKEGTDVTNMERHLGKFFEYTNAGIKQNLNPGDVEKWGRVGQCTILYKFNNPLTFKELSSLKVNFSNIGPVKESNSYFTTTLIDLSICLESNIKKMYLKGLPLTLDKKQLIDLKTHKNPPLYGPIGDVFNDDTNIDVMQMTFYLRGYEGLNGGSYFGLPFLEIESIEAVPEPFSLCTLGVGIAQLVKRKLRPKFTFN